MTISKTANPIVLWAVSIPVVVFVQLVIDTAILTLGWSWFLVPIGAPALGFWQLAGVNVVVSHMTIGNQVPIKGQEPDGARMLINVFLWRPTITLGALVLCNWLAR